ncbi:hypothetical protein A4D02_07370 [Niastella koreensis]|uniref:Uncharacterized protein n=2 Tax=Niastella koreensis TaxID=354356 RepID=G8TJR6_NIAKG|nr:hypothetical protein [Niastella koreensis]AEW01814.1 hypothetical protein Niako_5582 [Niastella koreensis GR20-10]OQP48524.1 hypothetical protein A4D02_07370 [Niastella koreensis]
MKSKFTSLVYVFIFFFLAKSCISDYMTPGKYDGEISKYERLIKDSTTAIGFLDSNYTRVKRFGVMTNSFTYHFKVNGEEYKGYHDFKKLPESPIVKVYYQKDNPATSDLDPWASRDSIKRQKEGSHSISTLLTGIIFGLFGIGYIVVFIRQLTGKLKPEQEPDQGPSNVMGY